MTKLFEFSESHNEIHPNRTCFEVFIENRPFGFIEKNANGWDCFDINNKYVGHRSTRISAAWKLNVPVSIGRFDTFEQAQQFKPSQGFERVGVREVFLKNGRTVFAALIEKENENV